MARILVVDDSRLMRHILRQFLEGGGHEVVEWAEVSATEVADRLAEAAPDLLLTDYQMPGCNGLTLARLARRAKPGLPIIVVTALRDPAVLEALRKQEVNRILHKPLSEQDLLATVAPLV
ncbi:MAG TPA: response regulator [Holophagaceae bacterium]